MSIKIYDTEQPDAIARKIWNNFEVHQSCTIYGFYRDGEELIPKGEAILRILRALYEVDHCWDKAGKQFRKYQWKANSVGGPIAHKIFTWEKRVVDNEVRYTIWRFQ